MADDSIQWTIAAGTRCDLVAYAARDLSGKRSTMQCFPGGNRKGGRFAPGELRSMVVRAPFGTRITLRATPGELWEELPWRTVRVVEGRHVPSSRSGGLPGVRIPDLDRLDDPDAKRTARDLVSSYPRPADGGEEPWTFGRPGDLAGRVRSIHIERDDAVARLLPLEQLARDLLAALPGDVRAATLPAALDALERQLRATGRRDAETRLAALRTWAEAHEH